MKIIKLSWILIGDPLADLSETGTPALFIVNDFLTPSKNGLKLSSTSNCPNVQPEKLSSWTYSTIMRKSLKFAGVPVVGIPAKFVVLAGIVNTSSTA